MNNIWTDFISATHGRRIICYGAGARGRNMTSNPLFTPYLPKVDFFIDRDAAKTGQKIRTTSRDLIIYSLDKLDLASDKYLIVVTPKDYSDIGEMLTEKGIIWFSWLQLFSECVFRDFENKGISEYSNTPRLFLLNTPNYFNLGDVAIAVAERTYINCRFGDFYELGTDVCYKENLEYLSKYVRKNDIIFIQGGGNIGSLWPGIHQQIVDILATFKDNRIIIFPQSVFYGDSEADISCFKESCGVFNNTNLLVCVREKRSYDFVVSSYNCKCMLLPDMVLTINRKIDHVKQGIGVLLREDREKYIDNSYSDIIHKAAGNVQKHVQKITHHPYECEDLNNEFEKTLKLYSSCQLVITDRLHGMIFAAITNTPCIAFDNSYHKVSSVYDAWLNEYNSITVVKSAPGEEQLTDIIAEKIESDVQPFDSEIFLEKLFPLTQYIERFISATPGETCNP